MSATITLIVFYLFVPIASAQLPQGFVKFEIGGNLNPTDLAISPDGRVFITEKDGLVRIVENDVLLPDPFVILQVEDFNEQGLGHVALHPDFPQEPYVYLYYTVADSGGMSHNRLVRFTADGNFAVPGSELVLYECDPSLGTIHHGGDIVFGADGKLYLSTGDKGRSEMVQSLNSDLGKLLRLNPDGSIPPDNPFYATGSGKYRSIYALGFRNPYSMAVQPETGRLFVCDVGGSLWEEVNTISAGKNYGWPVVEGKRTSQEVPADYQDPLYAYDHETGCSVVGAAFTPQTGSNIPLAYRGRFFFADYCKGYIKVMDTYANPGIAVFATGINRPVGIAINAASEMYFLARAGIGGGGFEDNTESENGSIWKIKFTGSDAPFVYAHPKNALMVDGEPLLLTTQALGQKPLQYRWQKNGADLPAPDSFSLFIGALTLADSNAAFRCIVSNALGSDTSETAHIRVTSNRRPVLEILTPQMDFQYHAGRDIQFSGLATDPESGVMPVASTFWKADFHHDEHLHPVMMPTQGITAGSIHVPTVGEPDDNVWYRLHFSATDQAGLTQHIYRDVFPAKIPVIVTSNITGVPVDADGFLGKTPYTFLSVAGLGRSLWVPGFIDEPDSVLLFSHWQNGESFQRLSFVTPDTGTYQASAEYDRVPKAQGFGLLGNYYREAVWPWGFDEALLYSRIDSMVNFEWKEGSPQPGYVPDDGFTVAWTGQVVPYVDDTYTFYTVTDDGARLWVGDSLLVDRFVPQPTSEHSGSLALKGGKRYPVRFEFLESGGAATAKLLWSTMNMPKQVIPVRQLFPPQSAIPNRISGLVWLDTDADGERHPLETGLSGAAVLLKDAQTNVPVSSTLTDSLGLYSFTAVNSGAYYMQVFPPLYAGQVAPGFGLSVAGISDKLEPGGEEVLERNFAFRPGTGVLTWADRAWGLAPNPARGTVTFRKNPAAFQQRFDIGIYAADGRLCLEEEIAENVWETVLDLGAFSPGFYFVKAGDRVEKLLVY